MTIPLNQLKSVLKKHYDVFVASASYEKRSLSIMTAIINDIGFSHKIVSVSIPHKKLMVDNINLFKENGFIELEIDNTNQIDTVNNIVPIVGEILSNNTKASFLIDITTFTRQTLLILLRLLRSILTKDNEIQFLYTPAEEYSIGLPYKEKWLTQGISNVTSILGYSGIIRPSRPHHLIILMGFEVERASSLIDAYEPSKISIGLAGKGNSISQEHYLLNQQKFNELLAEFPYAESFEFSCINTLESKKNILDQIKKYPGYNTVICPMNNKISTISCALAAFDNNEIQLAIAIPAIYNYENYSTPGNYCYLIEIPDLIKNT
jgi:hypothetical protein